MTPTIFPVLRWMYAETMSFVLSIASTTSFKDTIGSDVGFVTRRLRGRA
jgi:hypothetical protein